MGLTAGNGPISTLEAVKEDEGGRILPGPYVSLGWGAFNGCASVLKTSREGKWLEKFNQH